MRPFTNDTAGTHDGLITLPQTISQDVQLGALAMEARQLRLISVHPNQDEVLLEYLDATGVMDRVVNGELDFDLLDPARTRGALGNILGEG